MVEARQVDKWEGQPDREVVGDPLKGEAFLEEGARGGGGKRNERGELNDIFIQKSSNLLM